MNKGQKVNWIRGWLQRFGDRDNETFSTEFIVSGVSWELSLQYDYDFDGDALEPMDWCRDGFRHLHNNTISDRTEEELDDIINKLKTDKLYH